MSINVPFNFQPTSVSVKTGSYTIPAGSYAFITAEVEDGGSFSIDGNAALSSEAETTSALVAVDLNSNASSLTTVYTVPSNHIFEGQVIKTISADWYVGGQAITFGSNQANTVIQFKAGAGQAIAIDNGGSGTNTLTGYARRIFEPETALVGSFWVPTGTNINGSGAWKATVSLYNEIT